MKHPVQGRIQDFTQSAAKFLKRIKNYKKRKFSVDRAKVKKNAYFRVKFKLFLKYKV